MSALQGTVTEVERKTKILQKSLELAKQALSEYQMLQSEETKLMLSIKQQEEAIKAKEQDLDSLQAELKQYDDSGDLYSDVTVDRLQRLSLTLDAVKDQL